MVPGGRAVVSVVWALRSRVRVLVDVFEVLRLPQAHQLLLISCYQWPFVTFKSDVVGLWLFLRLASKVLQAVWRVTRYSTVRSFPHGQRVIRAARNPDISKLHTLTSHTSQRVTSPHTFFQKNITRVCLDCIVLNCIVRARERFRFLLLSFYSYDSTL